MQSDFTEYEEEIRRGLNADNISINSINSTWDPPIPFDAVENVPDFPTECLPGPMARMVECLAEATQTPEEMSGALALGVLATAFQKRYEVQVTPDWKEPLCLYIAVVAPPGERKSAVISAETKPIYEFEAQQREIDAVEIAQNRTERDLLESALQAAKAATAKGKVDRRQEALDLAAQLAEFQDLHPLRLLADDTTAEKLIDLMDQQGGCMTVCSAEGGVFDTMRGRYDQSANFDVYLKGHAGDPIIVDRIGRRANSIQNPRLTMMLTIQPEVLCGLMDNATFRGRGLCGRFLYAVCKSKVGQRNSSPPPVPEKIKSEYRHFVCSILAGQSKGIIKLSPEADAVRVSYQDDIEKRLANEWEDMRDWGGKLTGAMVRIAALIHASVCIAEPTATPISAEIMEAAVKIADFFGVHAGMAYQVMGANEHVTDAKYILKRLYGLESVTRSELTRLCRGRFAKSDDMDPAISILEDRGYIRTEENAIGYNNRVQITYKINPSLRWK